ncbi:facilitated trehalose transporter Tret1-like isoform X1 [Polistes fuscatus]|uniref:facilitated trehalose transporter Tret1-like isoform X1 n=2 Tax=Polistes fuscatus TaxID=30207 RepID=UPI001CAA2989|nr:facilitated trehalose transporter Tret1-like isoform X1 [Polistes fuscatus]
MVEKNVLDSEPSVYNYNEANERTPLLQNSQSNMAERNVGISQETLVSQAGQSIKAKRFFQYIASLAATLGAVAAGMMLAWTSPAGEGGIKLSKVYNVPISEEEFSWIGALAPFGAAVACIPIGILTDIIGRKNSMLILVVPFTIGWLLIIFANSIAMFYVGRFITGFSGGAFCVTAPMYTAEISESEIRGSTGSYFQLLLTIGILLVYLLGTCVDMFVLSIISAIVPLIFAVVFFFMPETPTYYLMKGNESAARASYIRLRGAHYNVEPELSIQKETLEQSSRNKTSFLTAFKSKACKKAIIISYGLMLFQQLSGVNAVIFYVGSIFEKAGGDLDPNIASIIVGVMQVGAVFVSTLIVDRLGRRLLLLISIVAMCTCTFLLGIYFFLSQEQGVTGIGWLPLLSVCVFIILFSLGFGPLPWMMISELFAPEIKGIAGSSACLLNWLMAFIVTKVYANLNSVLESYGTFWLFSVICAIGIAFVIILVPETKGKSLEQIQRELNT